MNRLDFNRETEKMWSQDGFSQMVTYKVTQRERHLVVFTLGPQQTGLKLKQKLTF